MTVAHPPPVEVGSGRSRGRLEGIFFPAAVGRLTRLVILLVGLHSCALGLVMLFGSRAVLPLLGFEPPASIFFTSQSGVFLLILGICYLLAPARPALVATVVLSKSLAVLFLLSHCLFVGVPFMIWLAAAGDAGMLAAVVAGLVLERAPAAMAPAEAAGP